MAAVVDIAGAAAPAAARPSSSASDVRAEGTSSRSGQAAGARKTHGAKASGAAKAGADDATAFDDFDAQLDAALPGSDDGQDANGPKASAKGGDKSPKAAGDSKGRGGDPVPAAVVLTPWTFIQPVEVTPVKADAAGTGVEPTKDAEATTDAGVTVVGPAIAAATETSVADASAMANGVAPAKDAQAKDAAPAAEVDPANDAAPVKDFASAKNAASAKDAAPAKDVAFAKDVAPATDEGQTEATPPTAGAGTKVTDPASVKMGKTPEAASAQRSAQASSTPAELVSAMVNGQKTQQATPAAAEAQQALKSDASQSETATPPPSQLVAAAVASTGPRTGAEEPAKDATVAPAAHAVRGEKTSTPGRSISAFRAGAQTDVSQSQGAGKGHHTSRVDASANAGSVDQRRGPTSEDDSSNTPPPATEVAKASQVLPVQPDSAPVVTAARDSQTVTTVVTGIGVASSSAADVLISGDAPATSAADVPDPDTPHRLVQSLRMQFLRGGGDAVVQLQPEHLGPVTVSLRVEQGSVEARITAANPVVAEWLQANHETLREGLQASGLTLDRLQVDRDGQSPDRRQRREAPARQRFRQSPEAKSTFELTI